MGNSATFDLGGNTSGISQAIDSVARQIQQLNQLVRSGNQSHKRDVDSIQKSFKAQEITVTGVRREIRATHQDTSAWKQQAAALKSEMGGLQEKTARIRNEMGNFRLPANLLGSLKTDLIQAESRIEQIQRLLRSGPQTLKLPVLTDDQVAADNRARRTTRS